MERSRVGKFALEEKLGTNRDGSVYRAVHVEKRVSAAIRFVPAPLIKSNPAAQQLFQRQYEVLRQLKHPNVVRLAACGFEQMEVYLVNELVDGESLADVLLHRDRLPWEMVVDYALQICAGLEAAHELGVVHEALCPEKILITNEGRVKIADVRFERREQADYRRPSQQPYERVAYLAPEQVREQPPITLKCDLYALGVIMFRMLTGRLPFDGLTVEDMLEDHVRTEPPRVSTIVMECPVWLDVLVGQLLEKQPSKRPHKARTVILALQETKKKVAEGMGVAEHAVSGISALKPEVDKKEVRKLLGRKKQRDGESGPWYESPWFLAGCLLVLIGGLVTWFVWPPNPKLMMRRADRLMATGDRYEWEKARRWYLEPLLERFSEGELVDRARKHMDTIEMDLAERRLRVNTRLGRPPRTEGERLFAEAWNYEQFGDRLTALEKYESMVALLDEEGDDRPYVKPRPSPDCRY